MEEKKKILLVFGTRPEAIKMLPLSLYLNKHTDKFDVLICLTGQHREMLDQVMTIFDVKANFDINIMQQKQDLYDVTSRVLLGMRDILNTIKPNLVLVHGDTATSMATALAAYYQQIPIGHIEAGLRTHNIYSPWPEEINRQITGRIAAYHFAPTLLSKQNLINEGVSEEKIFVTGNTVITALRIVLEKVHSEKNLQKIIHQQLLDCGYDTRRLISNKKMVLITGHRRENFGEGFINICNALKALCEKYPDVDFIYPVHPNPNVRGPIEKIFDDWRRENIFFIKPLEYLSFVYLMERCTLVLTDSGGIQEEAPGLGKPVLVMRNTTERPEAVTAGTVKLVGTDTDLIIKEVSRLLDDTLYYDTMAKTENPYGDGSAAEKIADIIFDIL